MSIKVSAHWVRNFYMLKNKYDHLHTSSETFVRHKKNRIRLDFLRFRIRSIHLGMGKDKEYEKNGKAHAKISDSVCNGL